MTIAVGTKLGRYEIRSKIGAGRAIIRYAMEINDPWLAELVRRADAGEALFDTVDLANTRATRTTLQL